jgi:glutathione S-transferase
MDKLILVIGNKNYSSWSMRPWVLMRELGIEFEEVRLPFNSSEWDADIARLSPSGLVPVLWRGPLAVWDTLAIAETLAEWFPEKSVWPRDAAARAFARSAAAEMHSGFRELRQRMPVNVRASHPGKGLTEACRADIARIEALWADARARFGAGGPFLFGSFCAADAMFAPVAMRFATYDPPLAAATERYCEVLRGTQGVSDWIAGALNETEFVAHDEPYASAPGSSAA